jgi:acyl-CoA synthetase (AMP-forming)/AMP-acid ligase II
MQLSWREERDPRAGMSPGVRAARAAFDARWRDAGHHRGVTLAEALAGGARTHGETPITFASAVRPAVQTVAAIQARAQVVAGALHGLGLREGDAIAVQLPNWPETAVAYHAAAALGLVLIPIVPTYGPAEVSFVLRQSGARAFLLPSRHRRIDAARDVPRLGDCPRLAHVITVGDETPAGTLGWASLEAGPAVPYPAPKAPPTAVALVVYTSGTTAEPKGVQHSHDSLVAELHAGPTPPPHTPGTVSLQPFPAGHTAGLVAILGPGLHGYPTILLDDWSAERCAELIERHRVTAMAGTPFMIAAILDAAEAAGRDISSLTHGVTGGGGVPPALIERADAAGWRVSRCYGATEGPSLTASDAGDPLSRRAGTDGRLLGGNLARIVDDEGVDVAPGAVGEIVTIGPEQFLGYTDPALNATAFLPDGWFLTGDIGRLDDEGFLTITDRKKDIIIRGGENVSSQEVEDVLVRHPGVAEVAVVAAPDERYGERVCAFIVPRPGATVDLPGVLLHFEAHGVARHKTPERLEIVAEMPRTPAGKVRKHELRALLG